MLKTRMSSGAQKRALNVCQSVVNVKFKGLGVRAQQCLGYDYDQHVFD